MFLKTSFSFLMFQIWNSFWKEPYLKVLAWRYQVSMISSSFKAISSSDSSLAEFRRVAKFYRILKSITSEETICWTSIFLFWFEILHLKYFSTKRKISKTPGETFQRPPLFLTLMKLSSFVTESEESLPANRILICLMFESLRCSVDFLKRQYKFFITCPLICFMMFHSFSVNSHFFENELSGVGVIVP